MNFVVLALESSKQSAYYSVFIKDGQSNFSSVFGEYTKRYVRITEVADLNLKICAFSMSRE